MFFYHDLLWWASDRYPHELLFDDMKANIFRIWESYTNLKKSFGRSFETCRLKAKKSRYGRVDVLVYFLSQFKSRRIEESEVTSLWTVGGLDFYRPLRIEVNAVALARCVIQDESNFVNGPAARLNAGRPIT